jgi:glycosyltransferase involved in cell wall biosynthesis
MNKILGNSMLNIAIPTYNRKDSIQEFFVKNKWILDDKRFNIHILDNASSDDTVNFCENLAIDNKNINIVRNNFHTTAEENVKRCLGLDVSGYLWVLGDRYQVSEEDVDCLLDAVRLNEECVLLLSVNEVKDDDKSKGLIISSPDDVIFNKNIMLAASCLSTGVYPESVRRLVKSELVDSKSDFPHTFVIIKSLISRGQIKYLPGICVKSIPGNKNWAYTKNWIEVGVVGWFKFIDSIYPNGHPNIKTAYTMFPVNTSLGTIAGAVKRRMMNIIGFKEIISERTILIKGVGLMRFIAILFISILPIRRFWKYFKNL